MALRGGEGRVKGMFVSPQRLLHLYFSKNMPKNYNSLTRLIKGKANTTLKNHHKRNCFKKNFKIYGDF